MKISAGLNDEGWRFTQGKAGLSRWDSRAKDVVSKSLGLDVYYNDGTCSTLRSYWHSRDTPGSG